MLNNTLYALSVYLPNTITNFLNTNKKPREKVYIVGNGWASYYFAKNLNKFKYEPIIIAPNTRVLNTPKLVNRVLNPNTEVEFSNPYGTKIVDMVEDINVDNKQLITKSGNKYNYKRVVFAIGSEPNDFGIPGVKAHTYKFKTIEDADIIGKKLHTDIGLNSTIYIIGSGITGIELGSKIEQGLFEVKIIEAFGSILPGCNDETKIDITKYFDVYNHPLIKIKLSHMVKSISSNTIDMEIQPKKNIINKKYEPYKEMIIWTGGIRFNGFGKTQLFHTLNSITPIKPRGLEVNPDFSLANNDEIYCLGDMVSNQGGPTAQNAKNQAIWLAGYFNSGFDTGYIKSNPYKVKSKGKLIHLANGTYLESEYYSGYVSSFVVKLIEWFD